MKRSLILPAIAGLVVTVVGTGLLNQNPAMATVLQGFSINTQDKAVTITLTTDQRAQYTTETQGKQFAIILPNTQLSQEQVNSGLPVVIDNKNNIIGRAVPTDDGKVKIILPNLSASDYSVSIQQKRPGQTLAPTNVTRPRDVSAAPATTSFEQIASSFPKPASSSNLGTITAPDNSIGKNASGNSVVRLSSAPLAPINGGNGTVWNPYVVKIPQQPQRFASSPYSNYRPVTESPRANVRQLLAPGYNEPVNTISVSETRQPSSFNNPDFNAAPAPPPPFNGLGTITTTTGTPGANGGTLSNLKKIPVDLAQIPYDNLRGLAQETPFIPVNLIPPSQTQPAAKAAPKTNPFAELKDAILGLPKWLLITMAVFLGGMGIFTLVGGLVLLRILFSKASQFNGQPQQAATPGFFIPPGLSLSMDANGQPVWEPKPFATQPEIPQKVTFQDTASVNAMDYLKDTADNVSQAVHNAVLIKFPAHGKRGATRKRTTQRRVGAPVNY